VWFGFNNLASPKIFSRQRGALPVLFAATFHIGIYRLRVSDRGGRIDNLDHLVLPIFLGGGVRRLIIGAGLAGVYTFHFAAAGLRAPDGRNRALLSCSQS